MMDSENTLLKITLKTVVAKVYSLKPVLASESFHNFKLYPLEPIVVPFEDRYQLDCHKQFSIIDFSPLTKYPQYNHHLHVDAYDRSNMEFKNHRYDLEVKILQMKKIQEASEINIEFIKAHLERDTEPLSKMSPFLKVVNLKKAFKWSSQEVKKGHKEPEFKERLSIPYQSYKDQINIEIWDKDTFSDDLIGKTVIHPYELLAYSHSQIQLKLFYEKKKVGILKVRLISGLYFK